MSLCKQSCGNEAMTGSDLCAFCGERSQLVEYDRHNSEFITDGWWLARRSAVTSVSQHMPDAVDLGTLVRADGRDFLSHTKFDEFKKHWGFE